MRKAGEDRSRWWRWVLADEDQQFTFYSRVDWKLVEYFQQVALRPF